MLNIIDLNFSYSNAKQPALHQINFGVQRAEVISVIGESGSGKSTLLKLIYGLVDFKDGQIVYGSKQLKGPSFNLIPGHSMMKYVAQDYDLLDFVTVGENVGKYLSNFDLQRKQEQIIQALEVVDMLAYKDEFPNKLSGGQRQRVSIARSLAQQPEILLLDEPFSNLDQMLKLRIRERIIDWCRAHHITVIFTTHDLQDALYTSDKILVLKEGKMIQFDEVEQVRNFPKSPYVAQLFGYVNVLSEAQLTLITTDNSLAKGIYIVYPEEIKIHSHGKIHAEVIQSKFQGRDYLIKLSVHGVEVVAFSDQKYPEGTVIAFDIVHNRLIVG